MRTCAVVVLGFVVGCGGSPPSASAPAGEPWMADFGFTVRWPGEAEETVTHVGTVYEWKYAGVCKKSGDDGEVVYSVVIFDYTADELQQSSAADRRDRQLKVNVGHSTDVTRTDFAFGPGKVEATDLRYLRDGAHVRRRVVFGETRLYTVTVAAKAGWAPIDTAEAKAFIGSFALTP